MGCSGSLPEKDGRKASSRHGRRGPEGKGRKRGGRRGGKRSSRSGRRSSRASSRNEEPQNEIMVNTAMMGQGAGFEAAQAEAQRAAHAQAEAQRAADGQLDLPRESYASQDDRHSHRDAHQAPLPELPEERPSDDCGPRGQEADRSPEQKAMSPEQDETPGSAPPLNRTSIVTDPDPNYKTPEVRPVLSPADLPRPLPEDEAIPAEDYKRSDYRPDAAPVAQPLGQPAIPVQHYGVPHSKYGGAAVPGPCQPVASPCTSPKPEPDCTAVQPCYQSPVVYAAAPNQHRSPHQSPMIGDTYCDGSTVINVGCPQEVEETQAFPEGDYRMDGNTWIRLEETALPTAAMPDLTLE